MATKLEKALEFTLKWEGGFVNDPADPGGATNKGITLSTYRDHMGNPNLTADDLKRITDTTVLDIYRRRYWNVCNCDSLDMRTAVVVFDTAVNCGPRRVMEWAKGREKDPYGIIEQRNIHYLNIIMKNPKLDKFKKGWFNRTNDLKKYIDLLGQSS